LQKMNGQFKAGFYEHTGVSLQAHLPALAVQCSVWISQTPCRTTPLGSTLCIRLSFLLTQGEPLAQSVAGIFLQPLLANVTPDTALASTHYIRWSPTTSPRMCRRGPSVPFRRPTADGDQRVACETRPARPGESSSRRRSRRRPPHRRQSLRRHSHDG